MTMKLIKKFQEIKLLFGDNEKKRIIIKMLVWLLLSSLINILYASELFDIYYLYIYDYLINEFVAVGMFTYILGLITVIGIADKKLINYRNIITIILLIILLILGIISFFIFDLEIIGIIESKINDKLKTLVDFFIFGFVGNVLGGILGGVLGGILSIYFLLLLLLFPVFGFVRVAFILSILFILLLFVYIKRYKRQYPSTINRRVLIYRRIIGFSISNVLMCIVFAYLIILYNISSL